MPFKPNQNPICRLNPMCRLNSIFPLNPLNSYSSIHQLILIYLSTRQEHSTHPHDLLLLKEAILRRHQGVALDFISTYIYLPTYLPIYPLTYLPTHLPTYHHLPTYLTYLTFYIYTYQTYRCLNAYILPLHHHHIPLRIIIVHLLISILSLHLMC